MSSTVETPVELQNVPVVEAVLRLWLGDPDLTLFSGVWTNGAIMELLPRGKARLTGQLYEGRFAGLRDLILEEGGHHVHLDLGRLSRVWYIVAPSVCFGFRPSFEVRIAPRDADPLHEFGIGIAVRRPYDGDALREPEAVRYFERAATHLAAHPDVVSLAIRPRGAYDDDRTADWSAIERVLARNPALASLCRHLPAGVRQ